MGGMIFKSQFLSILQGEQYETAGKQMRFKCFIKLKRSSFLLILLAFLWSCAESSEVPSTPEPDETHVSGTIVTDTVWNKDDSPYIVTEEVIVAREAGLAIEPGVEVRFDGFYGLIVQGVLNATGTPNHPILFTSHQLDPQIGSWKGITFDNTDGENIIQYARVEYADVGITCPFSFPQILDSWVVNNQTGISFKSATVNIEYNLIQNNIIGIDVGSSRLAPSKIRNNIITLNERGIVVDNSSQKINRNHIINNFEFGIVVRGSCLRSDALGEQLCQTIDARENWWGNTDAEEIASQILDHDDLSFLHSILYKPHATSKLPDVGPRLSVE